MNRLLLIEQFKPLRARLYVERKHRKGSPFYRLLIFHDRHELREFAFQQSKLVQSKSGMRRRFWRTCLGCARYYPENHSAGEIGCVLLCRERLGIGLVSHEMTHAALYHITHGTCRLDRSMDEKLAWVQGYLVSQFCQIYWREIDRKR